VVAAGGGVAMRESAIPSPRRPRLTLPAAHEQANAAGGEETELASRRSTPAPTFCLTQRQLG
jgi:hypothetical protein